jgi:hypothetical protein
MVAFELFFCKHLFDRAFARYHVHGVLDSGLIPTIMSISHVDASLVIVSQEPECEQPLSVFFCDGA